MDFAKKTTKTVYSVRAIEAQATLYGIKGMFDEAEDALYKSEKL
ncbi:MAG: hypothetical protein U5K54_27065 [Cytophagales bacterium]|nr:hypothetical protein [Cytophagales bacterium]